MGIAKEVGFIHGLVSLASMETEELQHIEQMCASAFSLGAFYMGG